jgi:branched-subunit amino acid aminotransferase/4-amino-4-deoxychorismate lyase
MTYAIVNGQLHPADAASVSIQDRGFRFGDGVFETIALHNGVPYQYDWHMQRLSSGLEALRIEFDAQLLQPACRQLMHKNTARNGFLRLQVTRGSGSRGYLPHGEHAPTYVIETLPAAAQPASASLWQSSYSKIASAALPIEFKLCQGLNSTLARIEATAHDCFEALLINASGHVCEASSANIFWEKDGKLFTPSLTCGVLAGSTRAALLRLCDIVETEATTEDLARADSVMLTNVAWGVVGVNSLQPLNQLWLPSDTSRTLAQLLHEDRERDARSNAAQWLIQ